MKAGFLLKQKGLSPLTTEPKPSPQEDPKNELRHLRMKPVHHQCRELNRIFYQKMLFQTYCQCSLNGRELNSDSDTFEWSCRNLAKAIEEVLFKNPVCDCNLAIQVALLLLFQLNTTNDQFNVLCEKIFQKPHYFCIGKQEKSLFKCIVDNSKIHPADPSTDIYVGSIAYDDDTLASLSKEFTGKAHAGQFYIADKDDNVLFAFTNVESLKDLLKKHQCRGSDIEAFLKEQAKSINPQLTALGFTKIIHRLSLSTIHKFSRIEDPILIE